MIVVDDHVLFAVLARRVEGNVEQVTSDEVFTTGSWYYRLSRAVHDSDFTGSLSRRMETLSTEVQGEVVGSLNSLPPEIGVLSLRTTVPVMAAIGRIGRFNLLQSEALASALVLHAGLWVTVASDGLRAACAQLGIELSVSPV